MDWIFVIVAGLLEVLSINYSNFAHGKHPVCLDKSA